MLDNLSIIEPHPQTRKQFCEVQSTLQCLGSEFQACSHPACQRQVRQKRVLTLLHSSKGDIWRN